MKVEVFHWYGAHEPYETKIKNLQKWIEKHGGAVQVHPPTKTRKTWVIATTDNSNRFVQK